MKIMTRKEVYYEQGGKSDDKFVKLEDAEKEITDLKENLKIIKKTKITVNQETEVINTLITQKDTPCLIQNKEEHNIYLLIYSDVNYIIISKDGSQVIVTNTYGSLNYLNDYYKLASKGCIMTFKVI